MKKLLTTMALSIAFTSPVFAGDIKTYQVTVTNATTHHVLTPAFIATHNRNYQLFEVGSAAGHSLATQAETGDPSLVAADAAGSPDVSHIVTGGLIPPATSETFIISANKKDMLTYSAMLAGTNDAFAAVNGLPLPKKSATYAAYVYDAGSEKNNEDCDFIPGPPCDNGSNKREESGSEGFVTIHNGVHGGAGLTPKDSDWRGPVAIIRIERLDH